MADVESRDEALMIERVLEPEAMDSADEASEYDLMDHAAVNATFVTDVLAEVARVRPSLLLDGFVIDVGAGTARNSQRTLSSGTGMPGGGRRSGGTRCCGWGCRT